MKEKLFGKKIKILMLVIIMNVLYFILIIKKFIIVYFLVKGRVSFAGYK
jgi:hypothetical protein